MERERVFWPDIKSLVMSGITVACLFLRKFMFPQVLEIWRSGPDFTNNKYVETITFTPQGGTENP